MSISFFSRFVHTCFSFEFVLFVLFAVVDNLKILFSQAYMSIICFRDFP